MITFELGVEDLADLRFAITPIQEAVFSLWALRDPGRYALHLPWLRTVRSALSTKDERALLSLVGPTRALPDFLTPRPTTFAPTFDDELEIVARTPPEVVRRDFVATYAPEPAPVIPSLGDLCDLLRRYWDLALAPIWPQLRLLLEADMTYRARQLATGGARLLFADLHPNVRWRDGRLEIEQMIGKHDVVVSGRGMQLLPAVFAYKPVPPMDPHATPSLSYPCRGAATLWSTPRTDATALKDLVGAAKETLLHLLEEPLATAELARRLRVTPSAVSQHLRVLHATGLITRTRAGRMVLYHRSGLGDRLLGLP
ncbi:ArsR/SmtB family transcription factor [Labedaea rhizosphaerae]|uniref:MarR family protein n=1 Tax=Labedaea rhizosphaerae TaxID=598644 RepID=A0A4R6RUF3_LABRH|nr:helix-turn-helix domain-containing protein [Labedaea rhizosphaerae]TDP90530.1 MarR family protein [Labedaea rhizosphaerae]